ncbi:MAG: hypothetical protein ABIL09_23530 [Gemmatimonadota bacterium]
MTETPDRHPSTSGPGTGPQPAPEAGLLLCHRVMRGTTAAILGAFLLIIALTTFSTGGFVQVVGKGLYYLILLAAATSLVTWIVRVRLEKRAGLRPS